MESPTTVECAICARTFGRQAELNRHMRMHDRQKFGLACPVEGCTFTALQKTNLKTHMNTHTGERPYKCNEDGCDFATGDPGSFTRHRKREHGYQPKGKSGGRKQTVRKPIRFAPYSSPSTASTSGSAESGSPLDSSSEVSGTLSPEIPSILDQTVPLSRVPSAGANAKNTKNVFAAYNTELIPKDPQVNDPPVAPSVQTEEPLPSQPGPPAEGYTQLLSPEEAQQMTLPTFDLPAEPVLPGVDGTTNASFNEFILPLGHSHGMQAPAFYATAAVHHTVYGTPASLPRYAPQSYGFGDTYHLPYPTDLTVRGNSYGVASASYGNYEYSTEALFNTQTSHTSFSMPNTSAHHQALHTYALDETYNFYTTQMKMSDWQMPESYI